MNVLVGISLHVYGYARTCCGHNIIPFGKSVCGCDSKEYRARVGGNITCRCPLYRAFEKKGPTE